MAPGAQEVLGGPQGLLRRPDLLDRRRQDHLCRPLLPRALQALEARRAVSVSASILVNLRVAVRAATFTRGTDQAASCSLLGVGRRPYFSIGMMFDDRNQWNATRCFEGVNRGRSSSQGTSCFQNSSSASP